METNPIEDQKETTLPEELQAALALLPTDPPWCPEMMNSLLSDRQKVVDQYLKGVRKLDEAVALWEKCKEDPWYYARRELCGKRRWSHFYSEERKLGKMYDSLLKQFETGEKTFPEIKAEFTECWGRASRHYFEFSGDIPPEFQKPIDFGKLPNRRALDEVMGYMDKVIESEGELSPPGLVAFGDTGTGKTRAIYHMIEQAVVKSQGVPSSIQIQRACDLSGGIRRLALSNPDELREWMGDLSSVDWLFIDDLHQVKFTPRYAEELFHLIDTRYRDGKAILVTCQMHGDALVKKLSSDNRQLEETASAVVRRIRDMCQPVDFDCQ